VLHCVLAGHHLKPRESIFVQHSKKPRNGGRLAWPTAYSYAQQYEDMKIYYPTPCFIPKHIEGSNNLDMHSNHTSMLSRHALGTQQRGYPRSQVFSRIQNAGWHGKQSQKAEKLECMFWRVTPRNRLKHTCLLQGGPSKHTPKTKIMNRFLPRQIEYEFIQTPLWDNGDFELQIVLHDTSPGGK